MNKTTTYRVVMETSSNQTPMTIETLRGGMTLGQIDHYLHQMRHDAGAYGRYIAVERETDGARMECAPDGWRPMDTHDDA